MKTNIELSNAYKNFNPSYILEKLKFLYALVKRGKPSKSSSSSFICEKLKILIGDIP